MKTQQTTAACVTFLIGLFGLIGPVWASPVDRLLDNDGDCRTDGVWRLRLERTGGTCPGLWRKSVVLTFGPGVLRYRDEVSDVSVVHVWGRRGRCWAELKEDYSEGVAGTRTTDRFGYFLAWTGKQVKGSGWLDADDGYCTVRFSVSGVLLSK